MNQTKTIFIMGRNDARMAYDTPQSMSAGLQATGSSTNYIPVTFDELVFSYDGTLRVSANGRDIAQANGIFLFGWFKERIHEDVALSVGIFAKHSGLSVLNSEAVGTRSRSKLSQAVYAALNEVAIAPFVFSLSHELLLQELKTAQFTFPYIVKSVQGARGGDNYLVHSQQELQDVLGKNPDVPFMAQAFVPNDGDYRVIVMGDQVEFVMHRQAQAGTHLSNTSQGGIATQVPVQGLPLAMREQAVRIAQVLGREITGVDMIIDKQSGQHYMLEINNMPQLSTGSLVPQKMTALDAFLSNWA